MQAENKSVKLKIHESIQKLKTELFQSYFIHVPLVRLFRQRVVISNSLITQKRTIDELGDDKSN